MLQIHKYELQDPSVKMNIKIYIESQLVVKQYQREVEALRSEDDDKLTTIVTITSSL